MQTSGLMGCVFICMVCVCVCVCEGSGCTAALFMELNSCWGSANSLPAVTLDFSTRQAVCLVHSLVALCEVTPSVFVMVTISYNLLKFTRI